MIGKRVPPMRLEPAFDPALVTRRDALKTAVARWAAGIGAALGILALGAWMDARDSAVLVRAKDAQLQDKRLQIERLQHRLAALDVAGECSTLFYLVEAGDPRAAGDKLYQASLVLDSERFHLFNARDRATPETK